MNSVLKFTKFSTDLHRTIRTLTSVANFNPKVTVNESPIFLQTKFRRPPTLKQAYKSLNSCNLIGTVIRPAKILSHEYASLNSCNLIGTVIQPVKILSHEFAYTYLQVKTSCLGSGSDSSFEIFLAMRNHLAEVSSKYLKPNDYIYVKGMLSSYTKADDSGKSEVLYKVLVSELNYVGNLDTTKFNQKSESATANSTATTSRKIDDEKAFSSNESECDARKRDRLLLWQVFFANPSEWWDNRHNKRHPKSPDFRHKDTKECLWIEADDPPWIKKQLLHYDSNVREAEIYNNKSAVTKRSLGDFL